MMSYLIEVTICWALFYVLYLALLSRVTFFTPNRLYLVLSLLLGLLLPLTPEWTAEMAEQAPAAAYYLQPITIGAQQVEIAITAPAARETAISWTEVLITIYILGAILAFSRFAFGLYKIGRLYLSSEKRSFTSYRLILTDKDHTPFSFFNFLFWSRKRYYNDKDRQKIIRHEEAHIRGWHSLDIILIEVIKIVFWFSPPVYLYSRAMRAVHEYLADEAVLKTEPRKKHYGHLLIRQSVSGPQIALANHFFHSQLKKRIIMMTKTKSKRQSMGRYLLVLPLVIGLAFAFAMPADGLSTTKTEVISSLNGQELPIFAGCETLETEDDQKACTKQKLMAFMSEKLVYPEAAKAAKKEGTVLVKFTVNAEGLVKNVRVVGSAGYGMDKAAMDVVNAMPRWTPAQKDGKPVATELSLPFNFTLSEEEKSDVYRVVDEMPRFPGCEEVEEAKERDQCAKMKLLEYIYSSVKYPEDAQKEGVDGTVVARFIINKEGRMEDIQIVRSVFPSLDAEVLRVMKQMNEMEKAWIPGRQKGEIVKVQFNLPVQFKLTGEDKKAAKEDQADDELYMVAEEMPRFPGCEHLEDKTERDQCAKAQLINFISENTKYPESAKIAGIEGMVIAEFVVTKNGEVQNVKVIRSEAPSLAEEAKRVVVLMQDMEERWVPGRQDGKAVNVQMKLPFSFKLPVIKESQPEGKKLELSNYQLSPNPSNGNIDLKFRGEAQPLSIRIFDNEGRELMLEEVRYFDGFFERSFDLSQAPKGTLFLQIRQGERVFTDKIVLQ